jgi:hypothetical protein
MEPHQPQTHTKQPINLTQIEKRTHIQEKGEVRNLLTHSEEEAQQPTTPIATTPHQHEANSSDTCPRATSPTPSPTNPTALLEQAQQQKRKRPK